MSTATTTANDDHFIHRLVGWGQFLGWGLGSASVAAALWQVALWVGILPAEHFPSIWALVQAWVGLFADGSFWLALWNTLAGATAGLVIALVLAVPIGLAIGRNDYLFHALRFPLEFLRPIPSVALIPLIVLMLGVDLEAKIVRITIAAFFPLVVQTTYGARDVDPVAVSTATTYRLGRARTVLLVLLPASAPYILTGVRIASAIALLVAISSEIIIGAPGLGLEITLAENADQMPLMYALIAMSGFLGILINLVVHAVQARLTGWSTLKGAN
jgi:ABC-type nitrate/sulfonate/bicarbonate transport system permease component